MSNQPMTEQVVEEISFREAILVPKLRDWRAKLSAKAKQEKRFRFYSLYGLVSHPETLKAAWAQVAIPSKILRWRPADCHRFADGRAGGGRR